MSQPDTSPTSSDWSQMAVSASLRLASISPTIPSSTPSNGSAGVIPTGSGTISPTISPTDQLTAMMIAFSCIVVFIMLVLLGSLIYRKDPFGCKSGSYQDSHADVEASTQHYSSRQTLVGSPSTGLSPDSENFDNIDPQSGQLFYVGVASTYCLPPMGSSLPHLPSYESVRKKDRQRQIHMMIADRFGLNEPGTAESPPTYEESVRHSLQELQLPAFPSDAIPPPLPPSLRPHDVLSPPVNDLPQYEDLLYDDTSPEGNDDPHPVDSDE